MEHKTTDEKESPRERSRRRRYEIRRLRQKRKLKIMGAIVGIAVMICGIGVWNAVYKEEKNVRPAVAAEKKSIQKKMKAEEEEKTPEESRAEEIAKVKEESTAAGCPQSIIDLIDKNDETLDFVRNYSEKKDLTVAETIGDAPEAGVIPHLLQWDERWGYASYGSSTIAASGCGPTCLSMVVAGLTGDVTATPYKLAKYSEENGYLDEENGTYWAFLTNASSGWGVSCQETMLDESMVQQELEAGHPIICNVGPGDFTQVGHYIVLTGYSEGTVTVNDPFSNRNTEKSWVYADIAGQIKGMWVYSVAE